MNPDIILWHALLHNNNLCFIVFFFYSLSCKVCLFSRKRFFCTFNKITIFLFVINWISVQFLLLSKIPIHICLNFNTCSKVLIDKENPFFLISLCNVSILWKVKTNFFSYFEAGINHNFISPTQLRRKWMTFEMLTSNFCFFFSITSFFAPLFSFIFKETIANIIYIWIIP